LIIVATREAIRAIPQIIREGAYACGATTWQVVSDHIVPYSSAGIMTGIIIGMARAIGETAPIITIGALTFIAFLPDAPFTGDPPAGMFDWLFAPFTVMPIQMFNWTSRPEAAFLAKCGSGRSRPGVHDPDDERLWRSGCATACARTSSGKRLQVPIRGLHPECQQEHERPAAEGRGTRSETSITATSGAQEASTCRCMTRRSPR
jgi:hypothetical protein